MLLILGQPPCSTALAFNYQYHTWTEELELTFDASLSSELVKV